jgi:hypothetical protein
MADPSAIDPLESMLRAGFAAAPSVRVDSPDYVPYVSPGVETMYVPTESVLAHYAERFVERGWSFFPQERDSGRKPALLDGRTLTWKELQDRLPTPAEVSTWKSALPIHNVAIITGKASGYTLAIDVDIGDHRLAYQVERIAYEILGESKFRRTGRPPKFVLVYRHDPALALRRSRLEFTDKSGAPTGDMIEILADGAAFTAYGKHHSVGKYFNWRGYEPCVRGPLDAPLVTEDQLERFHMAIRKEFKITAMPRRALAAVEPGSYDKDLRTITPGGLRTSEGYSDKPMRRDNYGGRLSTIKLAKSGARRVARRRLRV